MDVVEDYKLEMTNSIITPMISSGYMSPYRRSLSLPIDLLLQDNIIDKNLEQLKMDFKSLMASTSRFPYFQNHVKHISVKISKTSFREYLYYKIFVLD